MAQDRSLIKEEYKWDLAALYKSDQAWEEEFQLCKTLAPKLLPFKGHLGESLDALENAYSIKNEIELKISRLACYAHRKKDQDLSDSVGSSLAEKISALDANIDSELSWFAPEVLKINNETMQSYLNDERLSKGHRRQLEKLLRAKPHILSPEEESILALADDPLSVSTTAYQKLCNADFAFGEITVEGKSVPLTAGTFIKYLRNTNRQVRYDAFKRLYAKYREHINVITSLMNGHVKMRIMNAKVRHYDSTLECSLNGDNVSKDVYNSLIKAVHLSLPSFFKYVELRKRVLNERKQLEQISGDESSKGKLNMYDMYVPLVPDCDIPVTYEQAKEWIIDALIPLGEEYSQIIKEAFRDRWIDVYENKGKRSGAYSAACYGCHPFILTNFNDTINSVFTLAHELGHSVHSYLSAKSQPYPINHYRIFVAEVASTTNEALLWNYLCQKFSGNRKMLGYLYNLKCDDFKGTVFRQTMFAEFEQMFHNFVETDKPLTPDLMNDAYYKLNKTYYGPDVHPDKDIELEWARIPHFYRNFYVYKYATSFCASEYISSRISNEKTRAEMVHKYNHFLSSGQVKDPIDLLKDLGVDMTNTDFITESMKIFENSVKMLADLLK